MGAADIYAKEIHKQFKRYATWLPTSYMTVGMVGRLDGDIFVPLSNLSKFGIPFNVVEDPSADATYSFSSKGVTEASVEASASGAGGIPGGGSATIKVGFSRAHSVYFSLVNCVGQAVDDLLELGNRIMKKFNRGDWKLEYAVVTRVVSADSGTILQADSNDASIELKGDVGKSLSELMNAGASVTVTSKNQVGVSIVAQRKLTPLLELAWVHHSWMNRVFKQGPTFDRVVTASSVRADRFASSVGRVPNVDFSYQMPRGKDAVLKVTLPKYGDYVDLADLLKLSVKASSGKRRTSGKEAPELLPASKFATRVHMKKLQAIIDEVPHSSLETDPSRGPFVNINFRLKKSAGNIVVTPLTQLATKAVRPKPTIVENSQYSFGEIDAV